MSVSVVNNPNPWTPYDTYRDCSQGICSVYCPQWCYIIFPPPPPPFSLEDDGDPGSRTDFSPLIIAVIGILASAFILVSYYTIISKYCSRRRRRDEETGLEFSENRDQTNQGEWHNNVGLDEALIKSITVCKYKRGDGFVVEGTDCSVCLSEFQEDESLRLLPKCNHAFHLPCIDAWLKSHSSCPLCRTNIASLPATGEANDQLHPTNVSVHQYQHTNEAAGGMLLLQDIESGGVMIMSNGEAFVSLVVDGDDGDDDEQELEVPKTTSDVSEDGVVSGLPIRRSVSLNSSSLCHQGPVSVADILSTNEEEEEIQLESIEKIINSRSRSRVMNLVRNSPLALKRSISTGRFIFTKYASKDGNSAVIPS